jgi:hypothetical protein
MATACSPNTSPRVNEEAEDIFALPKEQKDEEMVTVDPSKILTEATKKGGSGMTAADALLVGSSASSPMNETAEGIQDEEEGNEKAFEIPQRLTKSGRKRAVPFTLKVRTS